MTITSFPLASVFHRFTILHLGGIPQALCGIAGGSPETLTDLSRRVDDYVRAGRSAGLEASFGRSGVPLTIPVVRQFTAARLTWQRDAEVRWNSVTEAVACLASASGLLDECLREIRIIAYRDERHLRLVRRGELLERVGWKRRGHGSAAERTSEASPPLSSLDPENRFYLDNLCGAALRLAREGRHAEATEALDRILSDPARFKEDEHIDQIQSLENLLKVAVILERTDFPDRLHELVDADRYIGYYRWTFKLSVVDALSKMGRTSDAEDLFRSVLLQIRKYLDDLREGREIFQTGEDSALPNWLLEALAVRGMKSEMLSVLQQYLSDVESSPDKYDENDSRFSMACNLAEAGMLQHARDLLLEGFMTEVNGVSASFQPKKYVLSRQSERMADYLLESALHFIKKAEKAAALLGGPQGTPFEEEARRHLTVATPAYIQMMANLPGWRRIRRRTPWFPSPSIGKTRPVGLRTKPALTGSQFNLLTALVVDRVCIIWQFIHIEV